MKEIPIWVRLIAVLFFLYAVISLVVGIVSLFSNSEFGVQELFVELGIEGSLIIVFGIVLILISVALGFVGYGLWKARNWARLIAIILASLSALSIFIGAFTEGLETILVNIVPLILNIAIVIYLSVNKKAKVAFN